MVRDTPRVTVGDMTNEVSKRFVQNLLSLTSSLTPSKREGCRDSSCGEGKPQRPSPRSPRLPYRFDRTKSRDIVTFRGLMNTLKRVSSCFLYCVCGWVGNGKVEGSDLYPLPLFFGSSFLVGCIWKRKWSVV